MQKFYFLGGGILKNWIQSLEKIANRIRIWPTENRNPYHNSFGEYKNIFFVLGHNKLQQK